MPEIYQSSFAFVNIVDNRFRLYPFAIRGFATLTSTGSTTLRKGSMMGMITTLMMHFPVGSFVDALFFILKGYRLDGPPRRGETGMNIGIARTVTLHMLSDILMLTIMGILWVISLVAEGIWDRD